jgi:AraC-like DNA-binding protein
MPEASATHWELHNAISDVRITNAPSWDIELCALVEDDHRIELRLIELRNTIQKELDSIGPVLRGGGLFFKKIDLRINRIQPVRTKNRIYNPFLRLAAYDAAQAALFSGRDREIEQLTEKILTHRVVVLIGESGVGKTSLVEAGIVPRLTQYGFKTARFSFQDDPIADLTSALRQIVQSAYAGDKRESQSLPGVIKELSQRVARTPLRLFILGDHLEQMFTVGLPEQVRDRFIKEFSQAINQDWGCHVSFLFCIREDYLADLYDLSNDIPEIYVREHTFRLHRLSKQNGREVLRRAGTSSTVTMSDDLVESVLDDLCDEGEGMVYPPSLQIVGFDLYSQFKRKHPGDVSSIPTSLYEMLGRAEAMVNRYFESLLDKYGDAERELVASILSTMVTDYYTKRRVGFEYLRDRFPDVPDLEDLLSDLVTQRIIRRTLGEYELIHDFLARKVIQLVRQKSMTSDAVRLAVDFMVRNHRDSSLTCEEVAKHAFVTRAHLASLFRRQRNRTISRQLNVIRIGFAKRTLAGTRVSIAEIARQVGYKSLATFSRKFAQLEGTSPSSYRKVSQSGTE